MYLEQKPGSVPYEEAKVVSKLDLVRDDIRVASKQFSNLTKEIDDLTKILEDAEFRINEINCEKEAILSSSMKLSSQENNASDFKDNSNFPDEGQFFGYLNLIENREVEISAKIEANKQIQLDLGCKLNILKQENLKIKKELDPLIELYNEEEARMRHSDDVKKDLQIVLDQKNIESESILHQCEELKEELNARNEELNGVVLENFKELKKKLKEKKDELAAIRNKSDSVRQEYEFLDGIQRKELIKSKENLKRGSSVSNWRADRSILKNKLKTLKSQLFNEQKNLDRAIKRDTDLEDKYSKLLDTEEPNFGETEKARKCLLAQINESNSRKEKAATSTDLEYENEFTEQLLKEKEKIKKSQAIFYQYRDTVLSGLNSELDGCLQNGYIKLLRDELSQLQNELSKLV